MAEWIDVLFVVDTAVLDRGPSLHMARGSAREAFATSAK